MSTSHTRCATRSVYLLHEFNGNATLAQCTALNQKHSIRSENKHTIQPQQYDNAIFLPALQNHIVHSQSITNLCPRT